MAKQKSKKSNTSIKLRESYTSLFLGIVVVVVIAVLIVAFFKNQKQELTQSSSTVAENQNITKDYVVKEQDSLWKISEKIYGSGYNWVDIVKENKIQNPNLLYVGTKLIIPNVKPIRIAAVQDSSESITDNSYTIKTGDNLWDIAVRAYGDGYKWTELSHVNKLTNPDLIFAGNKIIIPR
jgi:lysozyme